MTYQVLVQGRPEQGYRATTMGWLRCEAEGPTKEEALSNIQAAVQAALAEGEILTLETEAPESGTPEPPDLWLERAGAFRDDPTWDEFQAAIAEYRREADARERSDA